jgi:hypothetical protein
MTSLSKRLQHLEATTARLDLSERTRELEQFSRTAGDYIRVVRQYLGEPPDSEMTICRNQSERLQVVNQVVAYRIRSLRHYSRQRNTNAECEEAGKIPLAEVPQGSRIEWSAE